MKIALDTSKLLAEIEDGVGWVTFNHPDRHNALNIEMWEALGNVLERFQRSDQVRVVIMRGAGGCAFSSGADISEFKEKLSSTADRLEYDRIAEHGEHWLVAIDKPLLAFIEGHCIGGGLSILALAADVRFATPDSTFGITGGKLGVAYPYASISALVRLVGPSAAADILFSGRFVDATEALAKGLVDYVIDREHIEAYVRNYAAEIGANAPLAIKGSQSRDKTVCQTAKRARFGVFADTDQCYFR